MSPSRAHDDAAMHLLWMDDLAQAIAYLQLFEGEKHAHVRRAILTASIISYCRPFTSNNWPHGLHTISKKVVPRTETKLHDELLEVRNNIIAHTAYAPATPSVKVVSKAATMTGTNTDILERFGIERIPQLQALFIKVWDNLRPKILKKMEKLESETHDSL